MGTGYRGVKDIAFEFREVQWSSPRGLVAFKPAPNPALNKLLEGDSNQKRLLKILLKLAHTPSHTQGKVCWRVSVAVSECVCHWPNNTALLF